MENLKIDRAVGRSDWNGRRRCEPLRGWEPQQIFGKVGTRTAAYWQELPFAAAASFRRAWCEKSSSSSERRNGAAARAPIQVTGEKAGSLLDKNTN